MADNQLGAAWAKIVAGDDVPLAKQHEYKLQHPVIVENVKMAVENIDKPFIIDDGADEGRIAVALREVLEEDAEIYHLVRHPELKAKTLEITKDFNIIVIDSLDDMPHYAHAVVQNVILSTLGDVDTIKEEIGKMADIVHDEGHVFVTTPNFDSMGEQFSTYRAEPKVGEVPYAYSEGSEYNLYLRGEKEPISDVVLGAYGILPNEYNENSAILQQVQEIPDQDLNFPDGTTWKASYRPAFYLGTYQRTI